MRQILIGQGRAIKFSYYGLNKEKNKVIVIFKIAINLYQNQKTINSSV